MSGVGLLMIILGAPLVFFQWMAGEQRRNASWRLGWIFVVLGIAMVIFGLF